jgi:hypothetical protein
MQPFENKPLKSSIGVNIWICGIFAIAENR